jgi:hypothetical protein
MNLCVQLSHTELSSSCEMQLLSAQDDAYSGKT